MTQQDIGIFTGRGELLSRLREACPTTNFVDRGAREACPIVIVDIDSHAVLETPPANSLVRVILCDGTVPASRRHGEMRVDHQAFLKSPDEYLQVAGELAEAAVHAADLEQEVSYLNEIHDMMGLVEADAVSEKITRSVLQRLGLQAGTLFLHDPRLERYVVSFTTDPDFQETTEFLPGVPASLLQHALASGERLAVERDSDGNGIAIMPLQVKDDLIGVIRIPLTPGTAFNDSAAAAARKYLAAVSQVLGNIYQLTRSRDLALRDDLTKAFNRRFFESYLDEEIERSRRYGSMFSIIFLDLDDLKMVNNFYGHLTGSRTLQEVAKRILTAVRTIDKVVRFGGDEFCIILPQTDQDQAIAVANRVRKAMSSTPFHVDQNIEISITASFGIAAYPAHAMTKEGLIRQADAAMYRVKSTTKNAVGVATVEDATKPATMQ